MYHVFTFTELIIKAKSLRSLMVKNMISLTVFKKNVSFIYLYLYTFFICINPSVFQSKLTIGTFFIQRIPGTSIFAFSLGNKRSKNEVDFYRLEVA